MVNNVQYQISLRDMLSSTLNNANRNVNNFDANVDEAVNSVNRLNAAMLASDKISSSFLQTSGAMALGTMLSRGVEIAGRAALDQVKSVISAGLDASKLRAEFATLAGDKSIGNMLFGDLNKYISDSIFGTELFGGARTLMGFGIAVEDILPTLKQLGDVSMGDKEKMQGLIIALGQVSANGKLMSQEVNQMINAGFNPLQEISRTTGKSVEVLRDEMQRGALSAQVLKDAFKSVTSEGGMFFGMLDSVSETPLGKLRAMQGNIEMAKQQLGEALLPALSDFMDASKPLIDALPDMSKALQPTLKSAIQGFTTLAKWLAKNGDLVAMFAKTIKAAGEAYLIYKAGIVAVTASEWLQTKAIQAKILLRGEETVAVNALTAATERLALAQSTTGLTSIPKIAGGAVSSGGAALGAAGGVLSTAVVSVAVMYFGAQAINALGDKIRESAQSDFDKRYSRVLDPNDPKGFRWVERFEGSAKSISQSVDRATGAIGIVNAPTYGINVQPLNFGKFVAPKTKTEKPKGATTTDPLKADIGKVTGQQVRNTYITINGGLIHDFTIKTTSLKESTPQIKQVVTQVLTDAINDSQITD